MKKYLLFLFLIISFASAQYVPVSNYLSIPENAIGYVDSCGKFWKKAYDQPYGGFYTNIDQFGNLKSSWGTNKNSLNQSRDAYGFTRAFQMTGDTSYLRYANYALSFMERTAWDTVHQGWYNVISRTGIPSYPNDAKTAYYQHYALLGLVAYYEAIRDTATWSWINKSYNYNDTYLWDNSPTTFGYYDKIQSNSTSPSGKSFNATVDALTTHLLNLYMMTGEEKYRTRLLQVADNMVNRLAASSAQQAIGFVELYNTSWQTDNSQTMTIMGHVLKTAWCLARMYELHPDSIYLATARQLADMVLLKGYDHNYGGPYKDYNRTTGAMLMWGQADTAKAWWQMEQAITSGLFLYHLTDDTTYLRMADKTLAFFMKYFVDHVYSEVFSDRTRYGNQIWGLEKGSDGKAAYHSIELGYYNYVYGKLFYKHEPITLYYNFPTANHNRTYTLKPIELPDGELSITAVLLNGNSYFNYDGTALTVNVTSGTGGIFKVTYDMNAPSSKSVSMNFASNWNLVSLPVGMNDTRKSVLFPGATSSAFSFDENASYQMHDTITAGKGYWLKFGSPSFLSLTGENIHTDSISVKAGWNLIGSISSPIPVQSIESIPGGLITSDFFGYTNGYVTSSTIEPGKGYWVKVSEDGILVLTSIITQQTSHNRITIVSNDELPPNPPNETHTNNSIISSEYTLEQNYPNPFNPVTRINYYLGNASQISLNVYNVLGVQVATLVDEIQDAGNKSVSWDASKFPSGVYYYKLSVGNRTEVRKMLYLR